MRNALVLLTAIACLSTLPFSASASTIRSSFINIAMGDGSVRVLLPDPDPRGTFRGSVSAVLCDGSVREGTQCAAGQTIEGAVSLTFQGSIFPFIEGNVSFTDAGAPTGLSVTFSTLIPAISGLADTELSGSLTVPQTRTVPAPTLTGLFDLPFLSGGVFGDVFQTVTIVPDSTLALSNDGPVTRTWAPITGQFDCALVAGCQGIFLSMGFNGLGGGDTYQIGGRFDVDPAAPIPLPASVLLLGAGLGALGVTARRRRS